MPPHSGNRIIPEDLQDYISNVAHIIATNPLIIGKGGKTQVTIINAGMRPLGAHKKVTGLGLESVEEKRKKRLCAEPLRLWMMILLLLCMVTLIVLL